MLDGREDLHVKHNSSGGWQFPLHSMKTCCIVEHPVMMELPHHLNSPTWLSPAIYGY